MGWGAGVQGLKPLPVILRPLRGLLCRVLSATLSSSQRDNVALSVRQRRLLSATDCFREMLYFSILQTRKNILHDVPLHRHAM